MSRLLALARPDVRAFEAYEYAEWDASLERLHANELPWRAAGDESPSGLNRYPEPQPRALVSRLASLYGVARERLLVTRGSDEAIDLLVRAFCRAGEDAVVVCPPTFGMYAVAGRLQGAAVKRVPLRAAEGFSLDASGVIDALGADVKLVFLCSPNNPTGNRLARADIERVLEASAGRALVVLDEAYVEFAEQGSLVPLAARWPHLVILRTLSKAYGLAGARCGAMIADPDIVGLIRRIIPPYAITQLTVDAVDRLLGPAQLAIAAERITRLRQERERIAGILRSRTDVLQVWPSDANFLLVELADAASALDRARAARLLVRDFRSHEALNKALRITIGTPAQNDRLLEALG